MQLNQSSWKAGQADDILIPDSERTGLDAILKDFHLSEPRSDSEAAHSLHVCPSQSTRPLAFTPFSYSLLISFLRASFSHFSSLIPVAQTIEIGASNAEVMGSTRREYKN